METRLRFSLISVLVLALASLACVINLGGPETPVAAVPVSTEAVESLSDLWNGALDSAQDSGRITLVVNETQLTSLLAFRLAAQENPMLRDPQVYLRDGHIQVYGTVRRGSLQATARMDLSVSVNDQGIPELELEAADFGPLPVPGGLLDGFSAILDEAFTGSVGPAATGVRVEEISIQNGLMAITGRIR